MGTFVELFMASPWIYWGIGPSIAASLGFLLTAMFCEWIVQQRFARSWLIVYTGFVLSDCVVLRFFPSEPKR
jgi:hypothetical protein